MKAGVLLDTNVLSEVVKKRPSERVISRLRNLPMSRTFTSAVCVMEIRFGAARHTDGKRLFERIRRDVLARVMVLPFDEASALTAGDVLAELEANGTPIGVEDVQIAATALAYGLVVATRNIGHFDRVSGLQVVDWWA